MRANDPDVVVVDAGVAGASIAAVLARGGSEVLLAPRPAPLAQRGVHRPAPRIAAGAMAVPTASIGIPCAVSAHAVTSAPKRRIWSPRARLPAVMPLARNRRSGPPRGWGTSAQPRTSHGIADHEWRCWPLHKNAMPELAHIGMSAGWRSGAQSPVGQFCAYQGWLQRSPVAASIGGVGHLLVPVGRRRLSGRANSYTQRGGGAGVVRHGGIGSSADM